MSPPASRNPRDVVIVSAVRTPLCRARKGKLAKLPPSTLLAAALRGCLSRSQSWSEQSSDDDYVVPASAVQDVCVGNVLSPASGAAALRMAQLQSGIPFNVPLSTVNRQCSSGLQAVSNIANMIASGDIDIGIGCGVESMSTHPMNKIPMPDVDWDRMKSCPDAMDCLIPMGVTSENVSKKYGLDRTALDAFAVESHRKASQAVARGTFNDEMVECEGITADDGIRANTTMESLKKLKPVFDPEHGSTTAGNSSQLTDGAAAVLLMSREEAEKRRLKVLGVWRGFSVAGVPPKIMGIGPAVAIPKVLSNLGLTVKDVDVFEINEAFASQASWSVKELGIDIKKVNPNGGAIALGHPLGCTGARQIATLLHEMNRTGKRLGVVSMCIGTGMGAAAVFEVEPTRSGL
mmetsp:Transcript_24489/g.35834  ORF Transcript_24489/g.35834 Transcript_24489/m.35834 type:complete len:405 (-) Transcript_24489:153-1367(-)|eukprot:CAMPEP_0195511694 /NCGR_PEP_ID=MMETSP0794_2-20130614/3928_1 /TAXON_ID=515487 /ORGANISM="Stephanopyxis turris, Strain CCMP 815" /LENGTH=404 /DNA_ID=CAMNT_0040639347 /DNA_START=45 /DNA_END=1259 /DNA_ORIENTATION=-